MHIIQSMNRVEAARRLHYYRRFFIIYAALTVSIVVVGYVMTMFLKEQRQGSLLINVAGRERMLLQKMTKEVLLYYSFENDPRDIHGTIALFDESLNGLIHGGSVRQSLALPDNVIMTAIESDDILVELHTIQSIWQEYKNKVYDVIATRNRVSMGYVIENNSHILRMIDTMVMHVQVFYETRAARIRIVFIVLSLLVIVGFGFTILFQINGIVNARRALEEMQLFVPICSNCKKIRNAGSDPKDSASWISMEAYFKEKSDTDFSHGVCPDCMKKLYPEFLEKISKKSNK